MFAFIVLWAGIYKIQKYQDTFMAQSNDNGWLLQKRVEISEEEASRCDQSPINLRLNGVNTFLTIKLSNVTRITGTCRSSAHEICQMLESFKFYEEINGCKASIAGNN